MVINTLLWAGALVLIILFLRALKTRVRLGFSFRVFIAMLLGMGLGLALYFFGGEETAGEARKWFALVGYGYVDLLRMLIIPLVPASIITGLMKLENTRELREMGGRTIGLFLFTATLASIIGLVTASLLGTGAGMDTSGLAAREQQGIADLFTRLRGFIPANPVASAAEMQMIPLVVFSLFVGIAGVIEMGKNPERVEPFRKFLESFLSVIMRVTKMVISLTPYGVAGLMAYWMSNTGLSALSGLGLFVAGVVIACLIQIGVVYSGLLLALPRVSPLRFFKAASPAMLLAFTSRSSVGTLTLTISTMTERLKVKERVANFVGPIGAVMNMDACGGIYPAMVAVFAANAFGIALSPLQYVLIVAVSILASIGSAGVPMGATAFTIITLSTVGLPVEAIGLVAGVDFLVDMFRTATNVTGDMMTSVVVGNSLGEFDREAFNTPLPSPSLS